VQASLQTELTGQNFLVDRACDGDVAWGLLQVFVYDLLVVDAVLPKINGISLCRRLREVGNPILILLINGSTNLSHLIEGLNSGADACLSKPIQRQELLAQIQTLARRCSHRATPVLTWGPIQLDPNTQQITCKGQLLKVSRKEYLFLELFLRHPRQMFSHPEIADRVWTLDEQLPTDATIKTHIRGIRRKLEAIGVDNLIQTHYGQGYRLNPAFDLSPDPPTSPLPLDTSIDSVTANIWQELMAANARLQQEIDQRKQVEAQLRRSETLLREAQRVAHIGSWEFDVNTRKIFWTEEMYHIHGLPPTSPPPSVEEIVETLIHPDDRPLHKVAIEIPVAKGEPFEANIRIVRKDGEIRYINARGGPIFNEAGELVRFAGTTFDITDWKQPEVRVNQAACTG
jgi:PAS domain S-box-containing protein